MRPAGRIAAVIVGLIVLSVSLYPVPTGAAAPTQTILGKKSDFRAAMRKLWEDHITWTRLYIVSVAGGLPDKEPTAQRLLQNQVDIGNAIKPYYDAAAGDKLTALLKQHILGAVDILAAAKANDTSKFEQAKKAWYANADEIAGFLSSANPSWKLDEMKAMMKDHLDLTLEEASARLQGNFAADISAYDKVHLQILKMADALSAGIINQFPAKFK